MSVGYKVLAVLVLLADLAFCVITGMRKKDAVNNADDYFVGGKKTGAFVMSMSAFASLLGAGLFVGQCGRGAMYGISAYWQLLGEGVIAGIVMALLVGPFLAHFKYYSMAHFISGHICGGDRAVRRIAGIANLFPNVFWAGSQIMGISYIVQNVIGIDYRIVAIICGITFISYTMVGGLESVLAADAFHGLIAIISCFIIIITSLSLMNFDLSWLQARVAAIDPVMWSATGTLSPVQIVTAFLTGFLGTLANPIYWNRAFAAKDAATCRKAYTFAFTVGTILPLGAILMGLLAFTYNQNVGDQALIWLVMNKMPPIITVMLALSVLAATLSSADTHLNCASANIVADVIDPSSSYSTEKTLKLSRTATLIGGVIAILVSMYFPSIYELANFGYTVCGGVLIPLFVIGLLMMDRKSETYSSKLKPVAARIGMALGIVTAIVFQAVPSLNAMFGGGIIPAVLVTVLGILLSNPFVPAREAAET